MSLSPIMRDYLVRFQQTAMRETGRRPVTFLRAPMDESLLLPGCLRPGYACWQPMPWNGEAPLGPKADHFHESIRQYVSLCQFLEIHFRLPVTRAGSPLSFLYGRVFESCKNTLTAPPDRAFEEAAEAEMLYYRLRRKRGLGRVDAEKPSSVGELLKRPANRRIQLDRLQHVRPVAVHEHSPEPVDFIRTLGNRM